MFRIAVALGDGSSDILNRIGVQLSKDMLGLGGEFVRGYDFIKVTPVRDYTQAKMFSKEPIKCFLKIWVSRL